MWNVKGFQNYTIISLAAQTDSGICKLDQFVVSRLLTRLLTCPGDTRGLFIELDCLKTLGFEVIRWNLKFIILLCNK